MLHTFAFRGALPTSLDAGDLGPSRSSMSFAAANDKIGMRAIAAALTAMNLSQSSPVRRTEATIASGPNGIRIRAVAAALTALGSSV